MVGGRLRQFIQSKKSDEEIEEEMKYILGDNVVERYGPVRSMKNRSLQDEMKLLNNSYVMKFVNLKVKWDMDAPREHKNKFSDVQMLRFFVFCKYDVNRTYKLMCKTNPRYFTLSVNDTELGQQLLSKTLFPLPGLQTVNGADVFYMKPSRYNPSETTTSAIIDNLVYVMNTISMKKDIVKSRAKTAGMNGTASISTVGESGEEETGGIAFIANMNDWTMSHFSVDYCRKFMQTLQGQRFPIKVSLFLIVNPPKWFDKIWSIMKPMLSSKFRKKVHMITEDELWSFLAPDYEDFLPDEFIDGRANTDQLVNDFVKYQQHLESYDSTQPRFGFGKKKKAMNRPGGGGFSFIGGGGGGGSGSGTKKVYSKTVPVAIKRDSNAKPTSSFFNLPYTTNKQAVVEETEHTASSKSLR